MRNVLSRMFVKGRRVGTSRRNDLVVVAPVFFSERHLAMVPFVQLESQ